MKTVSDYIGATNGKAFAVLFQKKDGILKRAVARIGVKKYLKGGNATFNGRNNDKGNVGVFIFERDDKGRFCGGAYRCINETRALTFKFQKKNEYPIHGKIFSGE